MIFMYTNQNGDDLRLLKKALKELPMKTTNFAIYSIHRQFGENIKDVCKNR